MDFPRAITRECMKGVLLMSVQSSKNQYHPKRGGNYNLKRSSARERLRNRYCPDGVRILFCGRITACFWAVFPSGRLGTLPRRQGSVCCRYRASRKPIFLIRFVLSVV